MEKIIVELFSAISCELRNPLTVVKEGVRMVLEGLDGPVNSEQEADLRMVLRNIDRIVRLAEDLSRFESTFGRGSVLYFMLPLSGAETAQGDGP